MDLRLPKIKFLVRVLMLTHRIKLFMMNTSVLMPHSSLKCLGQGSRTRKKRIESYTRVKQGRREHFSDLLQRLTKAVQIELTNPHAK